MRRLIAYAEKIFRFSEDLVAPITDRRPEPRIATATVIKAATCIPLHKFGTKFLGSDRRNVGINQQIWVSSADLH